ncbi:flagellar biosynthetic protein FliR [candidate division KSB1 bacterium]
MDYTNLTFHQFIVFFIGFVRVATILVTVPVFGYQSVPSAVKAGLAFFVCLVLFPTIEATDFKVPIEFLPFVLMILKEVVFGLVIGIAANFLFIGVQMAGEVIGLDMGFGMVNIVDPMSGEHVSIISQFKYIISLLLFLTINGHHFLLNAIRTSFMVVPLGTAKFTGMLSTQLVTMSTDIFKIAIQIGGPVIITLFLTSFVMGIIARVVPQMNIFIIGFPLKIGVGFIMIWASFPLFAFVFGKLVNKLEFSVLRMIDIMH